MHAFVTIPGSTRIKAESVADEVRKIHPEARIYIQELDHDIFVVHAFLGLDEKQRIFARRLFGYEYKPDQKPPPKPSAEIFLRAMRRDRSEKYISIADEVDKMNQVIEKLAGL